MGKWTLFWDMHSGGGIKEEPYEKIYIEAPADEARIIFYNRFQHNPERVSCTCCGEDYSVSEEESLEQASGYHRRCRMAYMKDGVEVKEEEAIDGRYKLRDGYWHGYIEEAEDPKDMRRPLLTMEEYEARKDVLVIRASEIKPEERLGDVPTEGYVWI